MATGVVLPLDSRAREWHDTTHQSALTASIHKSSHLLSGPMAQPPRNTESREGTYTHKPSLPPFSKFLSDTGHPDLFPQARPQYNHPEPLIPGGVSIGHHGVRSDSYRPSNSHPVAPIEALPQPRNGQPEIRNGHVWPYPNTSPLGTHSSVPGTMTASQPADRTSGPAIFREEVIPGRGPCYIYDDGTIVQKILNDNSVNPKWGTTKAGKPRKRLGQACNTCREKKIKCDPSTPKCAQCQKFGRECKFDSTSRSGPRHSGSAPSPSNGTGHNSLDYDSRRGSTASTEPVPSDHPFSNGMKRSSMPLENILSPVSINESNRDDSPDSRPPAKRPRISSSPRPVSEGWPSESLASDSATISVASPSSPLKYCWRADPYQLDRELTLYYTNKYFNHVDSATTCILPRRAFLRWVKESTTKSPTDIMLLYAILAMGTVFAQRPESKQHQDVFIEIVTGAVMKSGDTFSLQLAQTKLILAHFAFAQGQYNQAWDFCGSALRVAFGLKFHTEEGVAATNDTAGSTFGLDYTTLRECRRRTIWAAYIMDCFNGCCSASVTSVNRSDCHLRLPCSQAAYEKGEIPVTSFSLATWYDHSDEQSERLKERSEVGVLGYLVEIATIFNEAVGRIEKSKPQASEADRLSRVKFHQDTMQRLDAWDRLVRKHPHQQRDGREHVHGLHILYHYTAMISHRYVRYSELGELPIRNYVQGAYKHARLMLELVQRLSNHEEKDSASFRFAMLSPFSGFAITAALDIITAAGRMADLMSPESQMMSLISSGIEALEGLVDFWHSARRQRDMIKQRLVALLGATHRAAGFSGAFYFGQPMQSPFGLDQDIIYGISRTRYFEALGPEALGWDDRIPREDDFCRLD